MFVCATAAFMKRRSRMAAVSAAVPTAAQAAWRMNCRRDVGIEKGFGSINLFLDGEVRRSDDQMHRRANAIAHLHRRRWSVQRKIIRVGHVADDGASGAAG